MIEQFLADKSDFKKKTVVLLVLIIIALLGCILLNSYRLTVTSQKIKACELSQQQEDWLEKFDFAANEAVLNSTLDLVPLEQVETAQRAQVEKFRRHHLNLVNIQNGEIKATGGKKAKVKTKEKQLDFVQSSATVTGSWDDLIACLNNFERDYLVVITECKIANESSGLVSASMCYRIYYE